MVDFLWDTSSTVLPFASSRSALRMTASFQQHEGRVVQECSGKSYPLALSA